jgi:hypothetical protein
MPRPTRIRLRDAPGLSEISFSFIGASSVGLSACPLVNDANEMGNLGDLAAHRGGVLKHGAPAYLVEPKSNEGRALRRRTADRAFDLFHD